MLGKLMVKKEFNVNRYNQEPLLNLSLFINTTLIEKQPNLY